MNEKNAKLFVHAQLVEMIRRRGFGDT